MRGGPIAFDRSVPWRTLLYGDRAGEVLNGATITELAGGSIQFALPGGGATADPASGCAYVYWRARDNLGAALTIPNPAAAISSIYPMLAEIWADSAFADLDDAWVAMGFADDSAIAGANGWAIGLDYTGGVRSITAHKMAAGVFTPTTAASAAATRVMGNHAYNKAGNAGFCYGFDLSTAGITTGGVASRVVAWGIDGDIYHFLAAGRSAGTPGAVTGSYFAATKDMPDVRPLDRS